MRDGVEVYLESLPFWLLGPPPVHCSRGGDELFPLILLEPTIREGYDPIPPGVTGLKAIGRITTLP